MEINIRRLHILVELSYTACIEVHYRQLQRWTKRYSEYIIDPYLFSDLIKRQLALSNYDEIEIDLLIVFPYNYLRSL
jgi:hypothetical protein